MNMRRGVSMDHNSVVDKMISLREKVKLRGRKDSSTQTRHLRTKAKPRSCIKSKGFSASLDSSRQHRGLKETPRPSGSDRQSGSTNKDDDHHDYSSQEQLDDMKELKHLPLEPCGETDLPFVDTTAIKSLVTGVPKILYIGRGDSHSITCVRACDGKKVTKTFRSINVLQAFLNSEDAKSWLLASSVVPKRAFFANETKSNGVKVTGEIGLDPKEPSVKRIKQEVEDLPDAETKCTGILSVLYVEKMNEYKIIYFSPSSKQIVTKVFEKFSLLLKFLELGEVRGCLLGVDDKCKVPSSFVINDNSSGAKIEDQDNSDNSSYVESTVSNIKYDTEVLDGEMWSPDIHKVSPVKKQCSYLSVLKSYLHSDGSDISLGDVNEESVDDLEIKDCHDNEVIDEEESDIKPKTELDSVNRKSRYQSAHMDSEGKFPRKRSGIKHNIDASAIKPLIAGYPKISHRKKLDLYRIVCIRACDGQRVTATFRSLSSLQSFLNSEKAKSWLVDEHNSVRSKRTKSCPVSYDRELLAIKPEITFIKPDRLRVLCIPKCGKPKTKFFKCSDQGQNDSSAMQKIKEFLTGQSFISWITSERRCDNTGKGVDSCWIWKNTIRTGTDMRLYLDELLDFDCTKSVDVNPAIAPYLQIHHNPSVPSVSYSSNPGWGRAHRSDDTFSLVEGAPHDLFERTYRLVSVYVRCSSRSNMCRTTCGELISQSTIAGDYFSCCKEPVPAHNECSHCKATTSSYNKWHKMSDDSILCRVCYNYLRKKNVPRPLDSKKVHRKPFYVHNQCQYRLRLELTSDLQHWQIFYHSENKQEHDSAKAVGSKRFTLTERDYIDRVRSSAGRMTAKQIGTAYRFEKRKDPPHPMKQYQSRCKVVDSHILDNGFVTPVENITINPDWRSGECDDSLDDEVDCIEFEINDVEPEVALNTTVPTVVMETKPNLDWSGDFQPKTSLHKKPQKSEECLIVCYKCVMDPVRKDNPFSCRESKELDSHIKLCHRENYFCCSICFQDNIVESFPSLRILNHHIRQFHSKEKSFKKMQYTLQT